MQTIGEYNIYKIKPGGKKAFPEFDISYENKENAGIGSRSPHILGIILTI